MLYVATNIYLCILMLNYPYYYLLSTYSYIEAWEKVALSASSIL